MIAELQWYFLIGVAVTVGHRFVFLPTMFFLVKKRSHALPLDTVSTTVDLMHALERSEHGLGILFRTMVKRIIAWPLLVMTMLSQTVALSWLLLLRK